MSYKLEIIQENDKYKVTVDKETVFYIDKLSELEMRLKSFSPPKNKKK